MKTELMKRFLGVVLAFLMLFEAAPHFSLDAYAEGEGLNELKYNFFKLCMRRELGWSTPEALANNNKGVDITTVTSFTQMTMGHDDLINKNNPEVTDPWYYVGLGTNDVPGTSGGARFRFESSTFGLQLFNAKPEYKGTYGSIMIYVPEDGIYRAGTNIGYTTTGGIVRVYLAPGDAASPRDAGYSLGSIDTYRSTSTWVSETPLKTVELTAGSYILSYEIIDKNQNATNAYFHVSSFNLKPVDDMPSLSLYAEAIDEIAAGQTAKSELSAVWSDTVNDDLAGYTVSAVSRDSKTAAAAVITNESRTKRSIEITGVGAGSTVIDVTVYDNDVLLAACEIPVTVSQVIVPVEQNYNFLKLKAKGTYFINNIDDYKYTTAGSAEEINADVPSAPWCYVGMGTKTVPGASGGARFNYEGPSLGANLFYTTGTDYDGVYACLKIKVSAGGLYDTSSLMGYTSSGGIGRVYLAPAGVTNSRSEQYSIGSVDTYSSTSIWNKKTDFRTVSLEAGDYLLSYEIIGKNQAASNAYLYISSFKITPANEMPDLSISVDEPDNILTGATVSLNITAEWSNGVSDDLCGYTLTAEPENPDIAEAFVATNGNKTQKSVNITGNAAGSTVISVTLYSGAAQLAACEIPVTVEASKDTLASVTMVLDSVNLVPGSVIQAYVTGKNEDGDPVDITDAEISYESSNPRFISVESSGEIRAVSEIAAASAVIRATVKHRGITRHDEKTVTLNGDVSISNIKQVYDLKLGKDTYPDSDIRQMKYADTGGVWEFAGFDPNWADAAVPGNTKHLRNNMSYGVQVSTVVIGQWMAVKFNISEPGWYNLFLDHFQAESGGTGGIYLTPSSVTDNSLWGSDRYFVGQVDYYKAGEGQNMMTDVGEVCIREPGEYIMAFKAIGRTPGARSVNQYPGVITLNGERFLKSITVQAGKDKLDIGDTTTLSVSGKMSDNTSAETELLEISFESSDSTVAQVDDAGNITAKAEGYADITVTAISGEMQRKATISISVIDPTDLESAVLSAPDSVELRRQAKLIVTGVMKSGRPAYLENAEITYRIISANPAGCASVDESGVLTAGNIAGVVSVGATVSMRGVTVDTNEVTIQIVPRDKLRISLSLEDDCEGRIPVDTTQKLRLSMLNSEDEEIDPSQASISYTVIPGEAAEVSPVGLLTAKSIGPAEVRVTVGAEGVTRTAVLNIDIRESGFNLMESRNGGFENDYWPWNWTREDSPGETPKFMRVMIGVQERGGNPQNRAMGVVFNPNVAAGVNPNSIELKYLGERVAVKAGRFYEISFWMKVDYTKPDNMSYMTNYFDIYDYTTPGGTSGTYLNGITMRGANLTLTPGYPDCFSEWTKVTMPVCAPLDNVKAPGQELIYITPRIVFRPNAVDLQRAGYDGVVWFDDFEVREVGFSGVQTQLIGKSSALGDQPLLHLMPYVSTGTPISVLSTAAEDSVSITSSDTNIVKASTATSVKGSSADGGYWMMSTLAVIGKNGTADIIADVTLNGVTRRAVYPFTIQGLPIILQEISISPDKEEYSIGQIQKLSVNGIMTDDSPCDMTNAKITFYSSNSKVAKVDSSGNLTAISEGSAKIVATAQLGGIIRSAELQVEVTDNTALKSAVITGNGTVGAGRSEKLNLSGIMESGLPAALSNASIEFYVENVTPAGAVSVSTDGIVYGGVLGGSADIRANVTLRGVTVTTGAYHITVVEGNPETFVFDFRSNRAESPLDATVETHGYRINTSLSAPNVLSGASVISYGMYGISSKINAANADKQSDTVFDVMIPYSGNYTFEFSGGGFVDGGLAALYIDGLYIGEYDFYDIKNNVNLGPTVRMRTLPLSAGIHTVTIRTIGTEGGGYAQYPGSMTFRGVKELPEVLAIAAEANKTSLAVGEKASVFAQIIMSDGSVYRVCPRLDGAYEEGVSMLFESSDTAVFTVDNTGLITPVTPGAASLVISASLNGIQAVREIDITVNERFLQAISPVPDSREIYVGDSAKIEVLGYFDDGSPVSGGSLNVNLQSDNQNVIIDGNRVTGLAPGTSTITLIAELGGISVSESMTITVLPEGLSEVVIETESRYMKPDSEGIQLTVSGRTHKGTPVNLHNAEIRFENHNPDIAAVSDEGKVTPIKLGSAVITASVTLGETLKTASITIVVTAGKTEPTYYTFEKRRNAWENIKKNSWAKGIKDTAVKNAEAFLDKHEELWRLIPGEGLPRSSTIGFVNDPEVGFCRYCGVNVEVKHGVVSWEMRPLSNPWKVQCPACKRRFPSNDFASFYKSGLNENGIFEKRIALQNGPEYLQNKLYPEKGEGWGVDDGWGYKPGRYYPNGVEEAWTYIAYYMHYGLWLPSSGKPNTGIILNALESLRDAYLYTNDMKYGRIGAIMIDRIADVYPGYSLMQYKGTFANSHGGSGEGKTVGNIWEANWVAPALAMAYDAFYPAMDDPFVVGFLSDKAATFRLSNDKVTPEKIRKNCEDGILRNIYKACNEADIYGNFGMHQKALALAAVILDSMPESKEMIDWLFRDGTYTTSRCTGGEIYPRLINDVSRDGLGNESASGYNYGWLKGIMGVAETLYGYSAYPAADLYNHPKFVRMFTGMIPTTLVQKVKPSIGDNGATANYAHRLDIDTMKTGFMRTGEPELAQICYWLNGNKAEGIYADIFTEDPEKLEQDIKSVIKIYGERDWEKSEMLTGYGFSILRDGKWIKSDGINGEQDLQRDFWIYFGAGTAHKHRDALNLGIEAYGINFAPDLGYPELTGNDPNRHQWVNNTISHNTVVVNETPQVNQPYHGKPLHFDDSGRVKLMDIDYPEVYPGVASVYRRTLVMVKVSDEISYGVDFFRIRGGNDHTYSFHSQSDEITETVNLDLIPQIGGTYAGPDVTWGPNAKYLNGYSWLKNVRRAIGPGTGEFAVDFKVKDFNRVLPKVLDLHLRMTMLNDWNLSEVAIVEGTPPRTSSNAKIPKLEYVLARRNGMNLDTLFTTVFEPYKDSRYIDSLESVPVEVVSGVPGITDEVKAIRVTHTDGRIDYIVYATNNTVEYRVDNVFDFRGFIGVCTLIDGVIAYSYSNDGDIIGDKTGNKGAYTGVITDFSKGLTFDSQITVKFDTGVNTDNLAGRFLYVDNDGVTNAVYQIQEVNMLNESTAVLHFGNNSLIRRYKTDINSGYNYDIAEGQRFRIPLPVTFDTSPVFAPIADKHVDAGSEIRVPVRAESPTGKKVVLSPKMLPRGATFNSDTGVLSWVPGISQVGEYYVAIEAYDGYLSSVNYFKIYVHGATIGKNPNRAPEGGSSDKDDTRPEPRDPVQTGDNNSRFIDLAGFDWARDDIISLAEQGIIKGTDINRFSPGANITRADFTILLVRALKLDSDAADGFTDVPEDAYFAGELSIAKVLGIIFGVGGERFNPTGEISRQDMMVIAVRALNAAGISLGEADRSLLSEYSDSGLIADYAKDAVSLLIKRGIVLGSNGKINPLGRATRAEVAVMIKRIIGI